MSWGDLFIVDDIYFWKEIFLQTIAQYIKSALNDIKNMKENDVTVIKASA